MHAQLVCTNYSFKPTSLIRLRKILLLNGHDKEFEILMHGKYFKGGSFDTPLASSPWTKGISIVVRAYRDVQSQRREK
jgi:hypothetical protein